MVGGDSSIYDTLARGLEPKDVPITGCVAAPTRLLGMQGAQNASVSSPVARISMFLALHYQPIVGGLSLPAGISYEMPPAVLPNSLQRI